MPKLTNEEKAVLHLATGLDYGDLSDPVVSDHGEVSSGSGSFTAFNLDALSHVPRVARIAAYVAFLDLIVFKGSEPIDAREDLVAAGVRGHLANDAYRVCCAGSYQRTVLSHALAFVLPMYDIHECALPMKFAGVA
ncbi:MAG: hypothetical protein AAF198_11835 [Pseudomonadota bacterium]